MSKTKVTEDSILRVGEVLEVTGRKISVKVDKNKNLSNLFFNGDILKNISVGSYIEIRKGFLSIIGKVEGERIEEDFSKKEYPKNNNYNLLDRNKRILTISLFGYIGSDDKFTGGTKELPLIGNGAYILTKEKTHIVHNIAKNKQLSVNIAKTDNDDVDISLPIDGLFNSHIAIFGNTGSGKSNTLASLYQEMIKVLEGKDSSSYQKKVKFILFDFNGEYADKRCITENKTVFNLSTLNDSGDKLPIHESDLLSIDLLSILSDATDKTQKPFLKRAISFYHHVHNPDVSSSEDYFKNILRNKVNDILQMSDKVRAFMLLDFMEEILPKKTAEDGMEGNIRGDLEWHNGSNEFRFRKSAASPIFYLAQTPSEIVNTAIYQHINEFHFSDDLLSKIINFLYLQLISDVISNRAQNEHVAPCINKLKSKRKDIKKIFSSSKSDLWSKNFIVVNLHDVNLEMKKTLPLLLAKKVYSEHKNKSGDKGSLNIIIDEAHNILSKESFRESESWKDYRLETFEEIIKEGRKFGVFVTISSQRPNDISSTIISQAHNYFIHRLINQKDLATISNAVSYIDKITEESIPTLPIGTCIFSGIATQLPLKINIKELPDELQPKSKTMEFKEIVKSPKFLKKSKTKND